MGRVLAMVATAVALCAAPAMAAAATIQPTPAPAGATAWGLADVSCTSPTACVAVGSDNSPAFGSLRALAEVWNGSTWTLTPPVFPPGALEDALQNVSCWAADGCMALGDADANGAAGTAALLERWDGGAWSIMPSPGGTLVDLSCAAATMCMAVGSGASGPLAELWNGQTWTATPVPDPSVAESGGSIASVSCATTSACALVGEYQPAGSQAPQAWASLWNGEFWASERVPDQINGATLGNVSCASATVCEAVGAAGVAAIFDQLPFVVTLDGARTTAQVLPRPPGTALAFFAGLSCTNYYTCVTTGTTETDAPGASSQVSTLAEVEEGGGFSTLATATPAGAAAGNLGLGAVSCSVATCEAVGSYGSGADAPGNPNSIVYYSLAEEITGPAPPSVTVPGGQVYALAATAPSCVTAGRQLPAMVQRTATPTRPTSRSTFVEAQFFIDGGIRRTLTTTVRKNGRPTRVRRTVRIPNAVVHRLPATVRLSTAGLSAGRHSLAVSVEVRGAAAVTATRAVSTHFTVCSSTR